MLVLKIEKIYKIMKKILVTGAKGQLGSELKVLSKNYTQFEWVFTDREELDLCDLVQLEAAIRSN